jgi:hypothetical protein
MTITVIVVASLFTAFEFLSIIGKMSPSLLRKVLGYEWIVDLVMSFGLMLYFGMTGSITGMIVAAITGFIFSVALYSAKHMIGYSKLHRVPGTWFKFNWIEYPATWSSESAGSFLSRFVKGIGNFVMKFFGGFKRQQQVSDVGVDNSVGAL